MWRPFRHLAHEGPRHTGRFGFAGDGVASELWIAYHHLRWGSSHYVTNADTLRRLERLMRRWNDPTPTPTDGKFMLGRDPLAVPLFVGECPCITRPIDALSPSAVPDLDHDLLAYRTALRLGQFEMNPNPFWGGS
jgi:hypothetical protein